jgi:hypothetical protein
MPLWPYYPLLSSVLGGTARRVSEGSFEKLHFFYDPETLFGILGASVLALPLLPYLVVRRKHLLVPLGALSMLAVFIVSAFVSVPLGHRYLLLANFFLQVGLVWLLLQLMPAGAPLPSWATRAGPRWLARVAVALLLVGLSLASVERAREKLARGMLRARGAESPAVRVGRSVAELAGRDAVVLGSEIASWSLPTFGPKIVALHHKGLTRDTRSRSHDVRRFFSTFDDEERRSVVERYGVTHVLAGRSESARVRRFLMRNGRAESLPTGVVLYALRSRR